MFFFLRHRFTTSDGITYLVEFARIENPFAWWEAQEAREIIRRDLAACQMIFSVEVVLTVLTIAAAFFRAAMEAK